MKKERLVYINRKEWMESCYDEAEQKYVAKYVKTKWYNQAEYDKLRHQLIDAAKANGDHVTAYGFEYLLDFDTLHNEYINCDCGYAK